MWIWSSTQDALEAIADKAIERNIGARGLRAVMEGLLTQIMYDVPSDPTIAKVVITKDCVEGKAEPRMLTRDPDKVQLCREIEDRQAAEKHRSTASRRLNR